MVILVDGATHGAQAVVTASQHIGQWELVETRSPGGLDDAHVGQVMTGDSIKPDFQIVGIVAYVVGLEDAVGDGAFLRVFLRDIHLSLRFLFGNQGLAVQ